MSKETEKEIGSESRGNEPDELEDKLRGGGTASRARNKTVMLTPDVAGRVRSILDNEPTSQKPLRDPIGELLPPMSGMAAGQGLAGQKQDFKKFVDYGNDLSTESEVLKSPPVAPQPPAAESPNKTASRGSAARTVFLQREQLPPSFSVNASQVPPTTPAASPPQNAAPQHSAPRGASAPNAGSPVFSVQPGVGAGSGIVPQANIPQQSGTPQQAVVRSKAPEAKIVGFLISFDKNAYGEVYELRAGRWLLTSRPTDHGDYILVEDDTISPLHAIIRVSKDGKLQVLDQLSEFGTFHSPGGKNNEVEISGSMAAIQHGDIVRFGKRHFVVCTVPPVPEGKAIPEGKGQGKEQS